MSVWLCGDDTPFTPYVRRGSSCMSAVPLSWSQLETQVKCDPLLIAPGLEDGGEPFTLTFFDSMAKKDSKY